MSKFLSRKWIMAILFSVIGFYLVMIDKVDGWQYLVALGANLGFYGFGNVMDKATSVTKVDSNGDQ